MKIEIKSHYWPETPHLREIKIKIDGEVIRSSFMSQDQILDFAKQFSLIEKDLINKASMI